MNNEFSYYFNGVRQTRTDIEFLKELAFGLDNAEYIINGILESKSRFDSNQ